MEKLTFEQIQEKADELSKKYSVKVFPIVFEDAETGVQVVGFAKEPSRMVKARVLDKALSGAVTAATELMDAILIKEESDPRIYSEASENDKYYFGAAMACQQTIAVSVNQFKKK